MATAKKRSKKTSAGGSAAAKKTTATRTSAARKTTRKAAPKAAKKATKKTAPKAAKKATKKAAPKAAKKAAKKAASKVTKKAAPKAAKKAAPKAAKKTAPKAAKKAAAKKATKKATKKTASKAAKKTAPKAASKATRKAAKKTTSTTRAAGKLAKGTAGKPKASARKAAGAANRRAKKTREVAPPVGSPSLFQPLVEGERAAALRILTEDPRLAGMANVGRYRVIAVEPLVVKPSHELADRRLARVVAYDYAAERSVDASVDLDGGSVTALHVARVQPMLAREEEDAAIAIALADEQVRSKLSPADTAQVAMHYWSPTGTSLAYSRRSAAVLFGQPGSRPSLVAVVDLLDNLVCEIVPAAEW